MKKTIAMLLALLLVAVMLPVTAMAAGGDVAKDRGNRLSYIGSSFCGCYK